MTSLRARALAIAVLLAGTVPAAAAPLALPEGTFQSGNLIRIQGGGGDNSFGDRETRRDRRAAERQAQDRQATVNPEARFSRPSFDGSRTDRRFDGSRTDRRFDGSRTDRRFDSSRIDRRSDRSVAQSFDRSRFDRSFDRARYDRTGFYNGYRGSRSWRRGHRYHDGWWFPLAAFATGAIIGGYAAAPPVYAVPAPTYVVPEPTYMQPAPTYVQPGQTFVQPAPRMQLSQAHVDWCRAHYRSYDVRTDTFKPYHGPRKRCDSPYA